MFSTAKSVISRRCTSPTTAATRRAFAVLRAQSHTRPHSALALVQRPTLTRTYRARRQLTTETPPTTISDTAREDIFYHLVQFPSSPSTAAYAISFLPTPPSTPDSSTILGWLPAQADLEGQEAGLNDFVENEKFRTVMHNAIKEGLKRGVDDIQINGAMQLQQGWMHIHDARNVPALNRVGDVDDIIATVLVEDSQIIPATYQAMPSYRLCTADGPLCLTEGLAKWLRQWLEQVEQQGRAV